jgi:SAM-dependent methyltransferase
MTRCRCCGAPLTFEACDFGDQPLANRFVPMDAPLTPDPRFPLRVMVCTTCLLVQLERTPDPALLFGDYAYLSSVSESWLAHARRFADMAVDRFGLAANDLVMELGSNDGYLLREFVRRGIACLGVEPAANVAAEAQRRGIPTRTAFFGTATAAELVHDGQRATLLVANNVLAHVPALLDFVHGLAMVLAPDGVLSIEVPHLLAMLRGEQFDTIYHEHVCYFSAFVLQRILAAAHLAVFDAELLPTHGGSLRILAQHADTRRYTNTPTLDAIVAAETEAGLREPGSYRVLADAAARVVGGLRHFLDRARTERASVAAYGAAAKGTMLLNAAQAGPADIRFVADANPLKQDHRMPGCRIPVVSPDRLHEARPDFLLILPWNIKQEIIEATQFIAQWGGRFVIPSPALHIVPA